MSNRCLNFFTRIFAQFTNALIPLPHPSTWTGFLHPLPLLVHVPYLLSRRPQYLTTPSLEYTLLVWTSKTSELNDMHRVLGHITSEGVIEINSVSNCKSGKKNTDPGILYHGPSGRNQ